MKIEQPEGQRTVITLEDNGRPFSTEQQLLIKSPSGQMMIVNTTSDGKLTFELTDNLDDFFPSYEVLDDFKLREY